MLEKLDGVKFPVAVNGQHLKNTSQVCGMRAIKLMLRIKL
jgi:hypothetical protein